MTYEFSDLAELGWNPFFSSQLVDSESSSTIPARVMEVHRNALRVAGPSLDRLVAPYRARDGGDADVATVGDWLLLDPVSCRPSRLLERRSLFKRRAAGRERKLQLIAANVDVLFIVTSCNQDFSVARLERYLVLAREAGVTPVVVLTKSDLVEDSIDFVRQAEAIQPDLLVETVNALDPSSCDALGTWYSKGRTVALLGSSGVGKSTLVNTLSGKPAAATQGIREDDDKGRHTTTTRALHHLPQGGFFLDTPGMRELQLTDVAAGLDDVFHDVSELAGDCRFKDCGHESEPGCAVLAAIEAGTLDADRLFRFHKLTREERRNTQSLAEKRSKDRSLGKLYKQILKRKYDQES